MERERNEGEARPAGRVYHFGGSKRAGGGEEHDLRGVARGAGTADRPEGRAVGLLAACASASATAWNSSCARPHPQPPSTGRPNQTAVP